MNKREQRGTQLKSINEEFIDRESGLSCSRNDGSGDHSPIKIKSYETQNNYNKGDNSANVLSLFKLNDEFSSSVRNSI